ncbi:poly [ADP-ribose] polymerase-like [Ctenocephalides felis]|uniref:poly [ADP-ribose] polymerase-like n=1 Tax=Ctenocephalides felis TaxID=7515 RepID=UPI000E6E514C|nr:poly [ADP-ribose] polymerase-like [Ctenocephalides felis]
MADELPYKAEYAKSGRAACKGCKTPISKDTLRLAVMVQSAFHDGKQPNWFHMKCFFMKQKPKTVGDIKDFASLRYEDQQKVQEKVDACGSGAIVPDEKGKGKKRAKNIPGLSDFGIEYAASSRAACRGCEQKIAKDEIRIKKTVYDTEIGMKYGGQALWHHLECFAKMRTELEYFESGDILPGFKSLSKNDKSEVLKQLPKIKSEDLPEVKKIKKEPKDEVDTAHDDQKEKDLQEQSKIMFKYRDSLKQHLKKNDMILLLEHNKQEVPPGEDRILDRLSDIMTFGALAPCKECNGDHMYLRTMDIYTRMRLERDSMIFNIDKQI